MKFFVLCLLALVTFHIAAESSTLFPPTQFTKYVEEEFPSQNNQNWKNPISSYTLSIVKESSPIYSYQNFHEKIPQNRTQENVFRIGSISKVFTTISILQVLETIYEEFGYTSVKDCVDQILVLDLLKRYDTKMVTEFSLHNFNHAFLDKNLKLKHLLTHTAGLEDLFSHMAANLTQKEWNQKMLTIFPKKIYPQGEVISYSNVGFWLVGYLIEMITKTSISTYVKKNIFQKLGMKHSIFANAPHFEKLSHSYEWNAKQRQFFDIPFMNAWIAAGAMQTTNSDMALFMLELLHYSNTNQNNGKLFSKWDTGHLLMQPFYLRSKLVGGVTLSLFTSDYFGVPILEHSGSIPNFQSKFVLLPEHKIGFFCSVASQDATFCPQLFHQFVVQSQLLPKKQPTEYRKPIPNIERYLGTFISTRRAFTTYEKIFGIGFQVVVTAKEDHSSLILNSLFFQNFGKQQVELKLVENDTFEEILPNSSLTNQSSAVLVWNTLFYQPFGKENRQEPFTYMQSAAFFTLERVAWTESLSYLSFVSIMASVMFSSAILLSIVSLCVKQLRGFVDSSQLMMSMSFFAYNFGLAWELMNGIHAIAAPTIFLHYNSFLALVCLICGIGSQIMFVMNLGGLFDGSASFSKKQFLYGAVFLVATVLYLLFLYDFNLLIPISRDYIVHLVDPKRKTEL